jgi:hypothetical protein
MKHRNVRGEISYIYEGHGRDELFGREWFSLTEHEDGQKTLRSQCEIEAGFVAERSVLRDVTYSMDARYRPLDCFVRLHRSGNFLGAGWFNFTDQLAGGSSVRAQVGAVSQSIPLLARPPSVGAHPLLCDMLHCMAYDHESADRVQVSRGVMMTSLELDGCSGPFLTPHDLPIEYLGHQTVTVPAGTFDTEHYRFPSDEFPVEDVFLVREPLLFVRVTVGGSMPSRYDLMNVQDDRR